MGVQAAIACPECDGDGYRFSDECADCAGTGRTMAEKRLKVRIPLGAQDGQVLRIRGQGGECKEIGAPGNLLLNLQVRPHTYLRRRGEHLELEVPLTLGEAVNGAQITIPTLQGDVRVTIPPGSANGATLRLRAKGATRKDGSTSDLYLVLRPTMPDSPSEETKAIAQSLDEHAYPEDVRKTFGL
jgi:molecular chaperone DnaJ